jgi:FixJ family two-component response regulator
MSARAFVAVVDDDESVRESLPDLLRVSGYEVSAFASAETFLVSDCVDRTDCLILDVAMPGMSGPELHSELTSRGIDIPTVFITARHDQTVRRRLIEHGAIDCLFKPFSEAALLQAINAALR